MHAGALWRDEVNSVATAGPPTLAGVWRLLAYDSFPLAWFLALRSWMALGLGDTDVGLRAFGTLGGLMLPLAIWFAMRRLTRSLPLASLALVAVNPEIIRWTASVRAWGVSAALVIVVLVLVREASMNLTRRRIALALVATVLAVHVTYQNAFLVAGIILAAAGVAAARRQWVEAAASLGIGMIAAVSLAPYGGFLQRRASWNALNESHFTLSDLFRRAWEVTSSAGPIVAACGVALIGLGLVAAARWAASPGAKSVNRARRGTAVYVMAAAMLSTSALMAFYLALRYPTQPWYYVGVLSLVAVCAEVAVASAVAARRARIWRVGLASVVLAAGLVPAGRALNEPHTNVDDIATYLNASTSPTDLIVVYPWYLGMPLTRYYTAGAPVVTIPALDDYSVHRYDLLKAAMMTADPVAPVLSQIKDTLESGRRVWIVGSIPVGPSVTAAVRLPPPPLPGSGWNSGPYEDTWVREVGAFIGAHVLDRRQLTPAPGGRFETETLTVLTGWK